ncbi:MAG: hypothetical protein OEV44_06120 [Spirochaetota bacterium]|nr:hypothetical protein [Spirochaetota bacterium]
MGKNRNRFIFLLIIILGAVGLIFFLKYFIKPSQKSIVYNDKKISYNDVDSILKSDKLSNIESLLIKSLSNYITALKNKNHTKIIDFMPTELVKAYGKENILAAQVKVFNHNKIEDIKISSFRVIPEIGSDKIIAIINGKLITIRQIPKFLSPTIEKIMRISQIIGISMDKGGNWFFLDPGLESKEFSSKKYLKEIFPQSFKQIEFTESESYIQSQNGQWEKTKN